MPGTCSIPLLCSIKQEVTVIQPLLLSGDPLHVQTAVRLLGKVYISLCMCGYVFVCAYLHVSLHVLLLVTDHRHPASWKEITLVVVSMSICKKTTTQIQGVAS